MGDTESNPGSCLTFSCCVYLVFNLELAMGDGKEKEKVREGESQTIKHLKTENKLRVDGEWEGEGGG